MHTATTMARKSLSHKLGWAFALVLSVAWPSAAFAQMSDDRFIEGDFHGVPYLSGGIGEDEREQLRMRSEKYNLKLVFAEQAGGYLADVAIAITDSKGRSVLDIPSAGPLVWLKVPAGRYVAKAMLDGVTITRAIRVGNRQSELIFRW